MHNLIPPLLLFCLTSLIACPAFAREPLRTFAVGEDTAGERQHTRALWRASGVFDPPAVFDAAAQMPYAVDAPEGRIYPVFFKGVPFQGKETRVFAWVGVPASASAEHPVPGIVLVHGGGGTAYREWVRIWIKRGYAAIAIDTAGAAPQYRPDGSFTPERHANPGPVAGGGFARSLQPVPEQWPYHAVAAIIAAHSLLRELPEVDSGRTGITGISWGSVLTSIAVAADPRFRFAVLVYGCGYMGINSYRLPDVFQKLPPQAVQRWVDLWDPSGHLGVSLVPDLLFINGTNDPYFPTDSWAKSVRLAQSNPALAVTATLRVGMRHGHPPAGDPPEVRAYADAVLNGAPALVAITGSNAVGGQTWVTWKETESAPVRSALLVYTEDDGKWTGRHWKTAKAVIHKGGSRTNGTIEARADAKIPPDATAFYFNLENASGSIVSSLLMGRDAPEVKRPNQ